MSEVTGETEVTLRCKCPKCKHEWEETQTTEVTLEFDSPDHSWRD